MQEAREEVRAPLGHDAARPPQVEHGQVNCTTPREIPDLGSQLPLESCQLTGNIGQVFR